MVEDSQGLGETGSSLRLEVVVGMDAEMARNHGGDADSFIAPGSFVFLLQRSVSRVLILHQQTLHETVDGSMKPRNSSKWPVTEIVLLNLYGFTDSQTV